MPLIIPLHLQSLFKKFRSGLSLYSRLFTPLFVLFSLFFLFSPTTKALAAPRIQSVVVEARDGGLFVSAKLKSGFQKKTVEDIHNGIPKDFYYYFVLHQREKRWFDEELLSKTILFTVKYDTLKKNYKITQTIDNESTETIVSEFKTMKNIVTNIKTLKLAPLETLNKRNHLFVRVKSQMQGTKRPFYLDYFLFFVPFLEIDTPWVNSQPIAFPVEK